MRWKWIPIIFASLVIVLIVALYIILSSYDFNKLKPGIEQAAYEATGRELKLIGDIELEIGFTPALVVEEVTFANAKWGSRPEAVSIKRFEVRVALFPLIGGNIAVKRLVLIEPDILIETDRSGKSNLKFKPIKKAKAEPEVDKAPPAKGEPAMPALEIGELLIENGRLTYKDGKTGKSTSIKLKRMHAKGTAFTSALTVDIKGSLDEQPFEVSGRLDSLSKLIDPSKGKVNISALKLKLGKNQISGKVDLDLSAKRPHITAELSSEDLDLRELTKKGEAGKDEEAPKKQAPKELVKKKVFPTEPIPMESLKAVDLDLRFKAKKLLLPALALNDLNAQVSLKDGRLKLKPLTAKVGGGTLDVNIDLRPKGKAVVLDARVKIDGLDLARMGAELKLTELLNGSIDADIKVKGTGASVAALMGSLNGEKKVVMGRGRIDNKFLKFAGGDLSSNVMRLLNPFAEKEDYTVVNCMVIDFDIKDGLAKSRALVFDTSYMSVVGDGKIDLKTEKLDISLKPEPKKGLGTKGLGKLTLSLGELARAFKLGGTLAKPRLAVDKGQTVWTIGKYIGGKAIFGPAGIAVALVGVSKEDENPCLSAIEIAKKNAEQAQKEEKKPGADKPSVPIPEELKDVGEGILKLFGK